MNNRTCTHCESKVIGRSDKKFCSDHCRVAYNNIVNKKRNNMVRKVNNILCKNRKILEQLKISGRKEIDRATLSELGFVFSLHTSSKIRSTGMTYYCYDQGWTQIPNKKHVLIGAHS